MSKLQSADEAIIKTERIVVPATLPLKQALTKVARANHMSVADLIRKLIFDYVEGEYPEFESAYIDHIHILLERDHNNERK